MIKIDDGRFMGRHIKKAILEMLTISREKLDAVVTEFNGATVNVKYVEEMTVADQVEQAYQNWLAIIEKQQEEYQKSEAYFKLEARRKKELEGLQEKGNAMLLGLPSAINMGEYDLVRWVCAFAEINDHIDFRFNRANLAQDLKDAGYVSGDCCGPNWVEDNSTVMARWIIGQAISMLESGMPIHPAMSHYVTKYEELVGKGL